MKTLSSARLISIGGILTALTVLFHSAPVFFPGIGLLLSPFATLPIALAAFVSIYSGIIAFFASAFILLFISPQEAVIFLSTTGAFGLALGATYAKGMIQSVSIAGFTLFIGINILTYVAGIAAFGDLTPVSSPMIAAPIFLLFSVLYSGIWLFILKLIIRILSRAKQFPGDFSKAISKKGG